MQTKTRPRKPAHPRGLSLTNFILCSSGGQVQDLIYRLTGVHPAKFLAVLPQHLGRPLSSVAREEMLRS